MSCHLYRDLQHRAADNHTRDGTRRTSHQALVEAQLEQVLDRVHDGVVLTSNGRATLNAAARRILAMPEGLDFRSSIFEPRALDGTPFAVDPNQIPAKRR